MTETDWEARGRDWWAHVRALADDRMEGRESGSPGYQRAADYVIDQFRAAGLEPAGVDGFRQWLDLEVSQLEEASSSVALAHGRTVRPLRLREEIQIAVTSGTQPSLEAEMVFVGYGLEIPEHHYSDLEGMDLRGKIAV
ncbi:peptidase M28, partial [mine drainage metagenome]